MLAPYLAVRDGAEAVRFYQRAFAAEEFERYDWEGKVGHAGLRINGDPLFLADEFPDLADQIGVVAPPSLGGSAVILSLTVDDCDFWFNRAVEAGCTVIRPLTDEFFGRIGKLRDPYGHVWGVQTIKPHPHG